MVWTKTLLNGAKIVQFVQSYTVTKGYPPKISEIRTAIRMKNVEEFWSLLDILEQNGIIERDRKNPDSKQSKHRGIKVKEWSNQ